MTFTSVIVFSGSSTIGGAETMNAIIANNLSKSKSTKVFYVVFENGYITKRLGGNIEVVVLGSVSKFNRIKLLLSLYDELVGKKIVVSSVTGVNFLAALSVFLWRLKKNFLRDCQ